ncbi:MAG: hypothetical protein LUH00_10020 [Lachnospiraceae bacterium]|nr:hypothetical protein [Lachnospiraceae bacterium]
MADPAEKQCYVDALRNAVSSTRDGMLQELGTIKKELSQVRDECIQQSRIIENCDKNRADYSYAGEQLGLIGEINRALQAKGVAGEARMACEYVSDLKDEGWRDAIEAFLGVHRYAVIVPPEAFDAANAVMDRSRHRYVELVNTKRLMAREQKCEEDSVFYQLEIRNETAARYFAFWLGRIHGVETAQVPDYDHALSKEGKMSRNMAVTYINKKRIQSYCLGSEAIELNRRNAKRKLAELEAREKELLSRQHALGEKTSFLGKELSAFREYNLNAHREAAQVTENLREENRHHEELLEAQKNNAEFMALSQRVTELEQQLNEKKRTRDAQMREKSNLEAEIRVSRKEYARCGQQEQEAQEKLEEERALHKSAVETAMEEYDGWLSGSNREGGLMQPATKERTSRRVRELEAEINGLEQAYNNRRQDTDRLPVGLDQEASYQKRRGRIWIDDLQGIQQKLKDQTARYERIFKREFVLNIYETAKAARSDIIDINKELRKLRFSTKYQFDVRLLDDRSDYAKILNYAEYLQRTNDLGDGQMTFAMLTEYSDEETETREREIRELINRIIEKNDAAEMERFADYRNYMSYEIIINNDEVKDGRLSRQVGYNSGAGTQIPYTLILSAALSMLYNARVNSVRLLFIDEPFEKMSDHNIKLMLDFFRDQDFQVIFCAPPNKLESIGSECGVIIPVLKISNDNMQIGKVKFHDG